MIFRLITKILPVLSKIYSNFTTFIPPWYKCNSREKSWFNRDTEKESIFTSSERRCNTTCVIRHKKICFLSILQGFSLLSNKTAIITQNPYNLIGIQWYETTIFIFHIWKMWNNLGLPKKIIHLVISWIPFTLRWQNGIFIYENICSYLKCVKTKSCI